MPNGGWTPETGYAEAQRRIAAEAVAKTGTLDISGLELETLPPEISALTHLQELRAGGTIIKRVVRYEINRYTDLSPLSALQALQTLDCMGTQVDDLSPLKTLQTLQTLNCSGTQVADLSPAIATPRLMTLEAQACRHLENIGRPADWRKGLELLLGHARVKGLPGELFVGEYDEDFRPALEAHFTDLDAAGPEAQPRAKLVVLGNGRVGKTQLRRRLMDLPFVQNDETTHGVEAHPVHIPHPDHGKGVKLATWDFGGQDIYHGTHALFTRSRAVYIICWHEDFETGFERAMNGLEFERRPLSYWLDFVR
ncbi:MAG: hypothetical protein AAGJ32_01425 [Pseudomonadota bacterium]